MGAAGATLATAAADLIFTGSDRVDVDFNADEQREGRGFWLKVIGRSILQGHRYAIGSNLLRPFRLRKSFLSFQ